MKNKNPKIQKPKETRFRVSEPSELTPFLITKMGGMSRNAIKSMLSHRQVSVNNKIITQFNHPLLAGDSVIVSSSRGVTELIHPKLKIIYEDQYIIVVNKKEGLLAVETEKKEEVTAFNIIKKHIKKANPQNRIYVVHRIDRETSGVLVFAKTKEAQLILQDNWHQIVTQRIYTALVEGRVEKQEDTIISWLTEHARSLKIHSSSVDNGGQEAVTHYRVVKSNNQFSLLEIELETGRKNQIRVHMQSIGHPIVGDKKYGAQLSTIGRMGLHARTISFYHPITEEIVHFETTVPREFLKVFHSNQ